MIIVRSPLRISLGGGGTDLPSYYENFGGYLIASGIDKYVYVSINSTFVDKLILKYSKIEEVMDVEKLKHPIVREAIKFLGVSHNRLEITSLADIPSGTGLGSSGAFCVAILSALHHHFGINSSPEKIAETACHIEIDLLGEPVGKQDQYISALGGLKKFNFHKNGNVEWEQLNCSSDTIEKIDDNLLLFFTGYYRSASKLLEEQDKKSKRSDADMINNLHFVKELGVASGEAIEADDLVEFGRLMNTHWEYKQKRSPDMSNPTVNECYNYALSNGAVGGKLVGAGGGGFLMFYTEEPDRLRKAMAMNGMEEVKFKISNNAGCEVLLPYVGSF